MNTKHAIAVSLLGALLVSRPAMAAVPSPGQNVDPFYLKSLREGESQFQAKHYKEASESLEIAAFGLSAKKDALGRTRVWLALCYTYLNERAKAEQNLKSAQAILGTEGLRSIDLPEPAKTDLAKVLKIFLDAPPIPKPPAPETRKAPEITPTKINAATPLKNSAAPAGGPAAGLQTEALLRESIRREPRQADSYYALAKLLVEAKDPAAAKAALAKLLENNPAEIRGHLELGRIAYGERRLKEAEKSLEKFLELTDSVPAERRRIVEAMVFLALSAYLQGDTKKAQASLKDAPELNDPAFRAGLGLAADDMERLSRLLQRQDH
jgi:tetratricopeptide (TPR) repeat protein